MNKDVIESQWSQIKSMLIEKFGNLSDDDIRQINGRYDELVAKLQQRYGYTREEAEERIRNWNFDRFTTPRSQVVDERSEIRENNASTFFKWLIGLGIPLILLGTYLSTRPADVVTSPPPVAHEQVMQETPGDLVISNGLREALISQEDLSAAMQNIKITTHDGVVTLSGSVSDPEIRDAIIDTAEDFTGVRQVVNLIEVK